MRPCIITIAILAPLIAACSGATPNRASNEGALTAVRGAEAAAAASRAAGGVTGPMGRGAAPDGSAAAPAAARAVAFSSEQRRGFYREQVERTLGNIDGAAPLTGAFVEVDTLIAQEAISADQARAQELRNSFVGWIMQASEERCGAYLQSLNETDREGNAFFGAVTTILGGLGGLFTPANTARALAGAAGISSGLRTEFNNTFFYAKTVATINDAILRSRGRQRDAIVARFGRPVGEYPFSVAVSDVQRFHDTCSLPGAFAELNAALQTRPTGPVIETVEMATLRRARETAARAVETSCRQPTSQVCTDAVKRLKEVRDLHRTVQSDPN